MFGWCKEKNYGNGSYWDLKYFRKSFFDRTNATFVGNFTVTTSDGVKDIKDYIDDEKWILMYNGYER